MPWKDRVKILYYLRCYCFVNPCRKMATRYILNNTRDNRYSYVQDTAKLATTEDSEQMNLEEMNLANIRHDASSEEEDNQSLNETNFDTTIHPEFWFNFYYELL